MIEKCKMNPSKNIVPDTIDLLKVVQKLLQGCKRGIKKKGSVLAPPDISRAEDDQDILMSTSTISRQMEEVDQNQC